MKLLQTFVVAGLLACTTANAGVDNPAAKQIDSSVLRLKKQLSLTEQQAQELKKIFKEAQAKQEVVITQLRDLSKKKQERMNEILTQEQKEKYEELRWEVPEHPGQPGARSEP